MRVNDGQNGKVRAQAGEFSAAKEPRPSMPPRWPCIAGSSIGRKSLAPRLLQAAALHVGDRDDVVVVTWREISRRVKEAIPLTKGHRITEAPATAGAGGAPVLEGPRWWSAWRPGCSVRARSLGRYVA